MNKRSIEKIYAPNEPHYVGDGFRVHNFIPSAPGLDMARMDPFIMLDYNSPFVFEASDRPRGVGVHPHRGFETVTIAYQGAVEHGDSAGGGGVIESGDVQWMTAGSGVLHKEFHETQWSKKGGTFQMVQLWVNLPSKDKMTAPKYQAITNDSISKAQLPDDAGVVEVIAGAYRDTQGSATTYSPMHVYNTKLNAGGTVDFKLPTDYNTALLIVSGQVTIDDQSVAADHLVLFRNDGEEFNVSSDDGAEILLLSGQPLHEPIAAHGPFVMNTREELMEAFVDFENGKFGVLED